MDTRAQGSEAAHVPVHHPIPALSVAPREQRPPAEALLHRPPMLEHGGGKRAALDFHIDHVVDARVGHVRRVHLRPSGVRPDRFAYMAFARLAQQGIGMLGAEGALRLAPHLVLLHAVIDQHGHHSGRADNEQADLEVR